MPARRASTAPIIPGILPDQFLEGRAQIRRSLRHHHPAWLDEAYDKAIRDGREALLSTALCTELCAELVEGGADALHFYTLNTPDLTREVCAALGVTPRVELSEVA
jgi:methylenetetrahydrofolate reductase (NADPH)